MLGGSGNARLVEIDDPPALAREIVGLLADSELRRALGASGAAFVRDYDWQSIARRLESIYRSIL